MAQSSAVFPDQHVHRHALLPALPRRSFPRGQSFARGPLYTVENDGLTGPAQPLAAGRQHRDVGLAQRLQQRLVPADPECPARPAQFHLEGVSAAVPVRGGEPFGAQRPGRPVGASPLHRVQQPGGSAAVHLGAGRGARQPGGQVEEALLVFLDRVPAIGDALLVNGDLFDFWFAYRHVIPRRGFHVAAPLRALRRRGLTIVMVGGNHDRWGEDFWREDLDLVFEPLRARFRAAGREILATHGDGVLEEHWSAALMHRLTRHPATIAAYRAIHPDLGIGLVDRLSRRLGLTRHKDAVKIEQDLMALLPKEAWIDFSHRMIHHGRRVCDARKPLCEACVMKEFCPRVGVKR